MKMGLKRGGSVRGNTWREGGREEGRKGGKEVQQQQQQRPQSSHTPMITVSSVISAPEPPTKQLNITTNSTQLGTSSSCCNSPGPSSQRSISDLSVTCQWHQARQGHLLMHQGAGGGCHESVSEPTSRAVPDRYPNRPHY
jgi:hypothetical protein